MRLLMSPGSRSAAFQVGCTAPSECTIGCLAERRLTRLQRIKRKNRLLRSTTMDITKKVPTALIRHKPYQSCSTLLSSMFLLHQPMGSKSLIGAALAILVSSTSMNAARETTTPMSHGLTSGVPLALSTEIVVALLIAVFRFGTPQPLVAYTGRTGKSRLLIPRAPSRKCRELSEQDSRPAPARTDGFHCAGEDGFVRKARLRLSRSPTLVLIQ